MMKECLLRGQKGASLTSQYVFNNGSFNVPCSSLLVLHKSTRTTVSYRMENVYRYCKLQHAYVSLIFFHFGLIWVWLDTCWKENRKNNTNVVHQSSYLRFKGWKKRITPGARLRTDARTTKSFTPKWSLVLNVWTTSYNKRYITDIIQVWWN